MYHPSIHQVVVKSIKVLYVEVFSQQKKEKNLYWEKISKISKQPELNRAISGNEDKRGEENETIRGGWGGGWRGWGRGRRGEGWGIGRGWGRSSQRDSCDYSKWPNVWKKGIQVHMLVQTGE